MTIRAKVIKLEAIRYSLEGLLKAKTGSETDRAMWRGMLRNIDRQLTPYKGATLYDESVNVGC